MRFVESMQSRGALRPLREQLRSDELIGGRFRVETLAGRGGMGAVYRALDLDTGLPVALKLTTLGDERTRRRFSNECVLLSRLSYPAIVRYVAHGLTAQREPFLAMEWLEGHELSQRLDAGLMRVEDALLLTARIADACGAAHRSGIIHRDIKPSNVMLVGGRVAGAKLLDFGVARSLGSSQTLTRVGAVVGSVGYMAPEQARGERDVDARADVFALGCLLYECLTSVPAFEAEHEAALMAKVLQDQPAPVSRLRPGLGSGLDALLDRLLAKDRELRPADGAAVLEALGQLEPRETDSRTRRVSRRIAGSVEAFQIIGSVIFARSDASLQATCDSACAELESEQLRTLARRFGVLPVPLPSGSLLFVLTPNESVLACDQAAQAARFALQLSALRPELAISIATGGIELAEDAATGSAVDRALGALAHPMPGMRIRLDALTASLLERNFELREQANGIALSGERVCDLRASLQTGREAGCVGRAKELQWLASTFEECQRDRTLAVLLLSAASGVGKSKLVRTFVDSLQDVPAAQLICLRAEPRSASESASLASRLCAMLETDVQAVDRHAPWDAKRLIASLAAACQRGPVLLVLEDMQWSDPASRAQLAQALRALSDQPLLVLVLVRPEAEESLSRALHMLPVQSLPLKSLRLSDARQLAQAWSADTLSDSQVAHSHALADGHIGHLLALLRSEPQQPERLPEAVVASVQARLEQLAPDALRVLRVASVFDDAACSAGLRALLGDQRDEQAALEYLVAHDVLLRVTRPNGEARYPFRHALLREAALAMLTQNARKAACRALAEWRAELGPALGRARYACLEASSSSASSASGFDSVPG